MSFNDVVNVGSVAVDMSQNSLTYQEQSTYLGPLRAHLLGYLCQNVNQVVGRDELSKAVWGRVVSDHTINQHISQLRKIIGGLDANDLTIATIPKKGYIARCEAESRKSGEMPESTEQPSRVLVLETNPELYSELQQGIVTESSMNIEVVNDLDNFHMQLMTNKFDALVVDIELPESAGLRLIQEIRTGDTSARADIPVLAMASKTQKELMGFNVLMDVQSLLLKRFDQESFHRLVRAAVASSFSLKPNAAYKLVPVDFIQTSVAEKLQSFYIND
ncbi:winged helix-turn-helix domain-containing protein [Aliagarivorans marinus]|uniref:winged helix-turn-helix domain-containing protein n=3 Tax=Aliagarivorans TaxID=882379 RepID=UPI000405EB6F|nr:winged helix-turn-helix domain-containing protein [Aliagarivorans marinus]